VRRSLGDIVDCLAETSVDHELILKGWTSRLWIKGRIIKKSAPELVKPDQAGSFSY
jgi:hypothetical protein